MDPIVIDAYAGDFNNSQGPDWSQLFAAGAPWDSCGVFLKATQGTYYAPHTWFQRNWPMVSDAAKRGAYHFLDFTQDGAAQADFFCDFVEAAGGLDSGDWDPACDVEATAANNSASAQQSVDCTSAFASRINDRWGRQTILYGGTWMYDHGITDHMGCSQLWIARYDATLPANVYNRIGWDQSDLFAWQYCGAGGNGQAQGGGLAGYPYTTPIGVLDLSALQDGSIGGVGGLLKNPLVVGGAVLGVALAASHLAKKGVV